MYKIKYLLPLIIPFFICSIILVISRYFVTGGGLFDFSAIELLVIYISIGIALFISNLIIFKILVKKQILLKGYEQLQIASMLLYVAICIFSHNFIGGFTSVETTNSYSLVVFMPSVVALLTAVLGLSISKFIIINAENKLATIKSFCNNNYNNNIVINNFYYILLSKD